MTKSFTFVESYKENGLKDLYKNCGIKNLPDAYDNDFEEFFTVFLSVLKQMKKGTAAEAMLWAVVVKPSRQLLKQVLMPWSSRSC